MRKPLYLLPQSCKPLLLGVSVDVRADDEGNDVEKGYPSLLREEFLGKGECKRRRDPADFHNRHETSSNSRANLMPGSSSSDHRHRSKIDGILNRSNLVDISKEILQN
jgi:hypothetical protein